MSKTMKTLLMGIGLSLAAFVAAPSDARADYCREYTRTVTIGGRTQDAYGTACQQSDGSWMIVGEGLGNDIPQDANNVTYVIHDGPRVITPPRVVYYDNPPPPAYYYYRTQPVRPYSVWYNDGRFYRNGIYINLGDNHRDYRHDNGWHNGWNRGGWHRH